MKQRVIYNFLLACLGTLCVMTSCKEEKVKVDKWDITDVRITSLNVTSNSFSPEAQKAFYSIDQAQGLIYNANPLPYKTQLNKIKLDIKTFQFNIVKYQIGKDNKWVEWNKIDSIALDGNDQLKLLIEDREQTVKKEYSLKINVYQFDPLTIDWQEIESNGLEASTDDNFNTFILDSKILVYSSNRQDNTSAPYRTDKANPSQFEKVEMSGLSGAIKSIQMVGEKFYCATTGNNDLLQSDNGIQWTKVATIPGDDFEFLGVLKDPTDGHFIPTLLINRSGKKSKYGTFNNGSVTEYEEVQSSFPTSNFLITSREDHLRPIIRLYGGLNMSNIHSSYWETTNGKDWLTPTVSFVGTYPFSTSHIPSLGKVKGIDLMICKGKKSRESEIEDLVYYSINGTKTWELGQVSVLLPHQMNRNSFLFAFNDDKNNIYLASSVNSDVKGSIKLFKGTKRLQN
ncbi:DUF6242 domain-containing protein [Falsiporphyromonas endometrii]|uniref:DUF6242 domain-containing protein n=1 Tax=Falsiporphyromonas endometrii TaxID=1387297 RepID=A0ABV9K6H6_9PORP